MELTTKKAERVQITDGINDKKENEMNSGGVSSETELIPKGYKKIMDASGDLNKDGNDDVAIIVEELKTTQDAPKRMLILAFKNKNDLYETSAKLENAILKSNEGGVCGDPLSGIAIDKGSVVLSFYGGSIERWGNTYRFRFQDNGWYMIGATEEVININTNAGINKDYNLITGKGIKTETTEKGKKTKVGVKSENKKLINIKEFIPDGTIIDTLTDKSKVSTTQSAWEGTWQEKVDNIKQELFGASTVTIENDSNSTLNFTIDTQSGLNFDSMEGIANIKGNEAVYKDTSGIEVKFILENDGIRVESNQKAEKSIMRGHLEGYYTKNQPKLDYNKISLIELGVVDTKEQEKIFRSLVGINLENMISYMHMVYELENKDDFEANVKEFWTSGIGTGFVIMTTPDNKMYISFLKSKYFTNDERYKNIMPETIKKWVNSKED